MTHFSKIFKMPKHQFDSMDQLPPKKPNIDEKKPNNFFDASCLQKRPNLWTVASKKSIWQP